MTDPVKHSGQVFTPDYLVKNILDEAGYTGEAILEKHCIDNSCGDGAFLCEIIRRYIAAYRAQYGSTDGLDGQLGRYIHGIEIDPVAYECCKENIRAVLKSHGFKDCDIDLRRADTLNVHDLDEKMDFVVGNPPYVRVHNLEDNFNAVKSYSFANGGMTDLYLVFFEIGLKMLKLGGKLCYITPSSWINSVAGNALRSYILTHRNLISIIDLGHYQAFKATTYTMISLFEKGVSNPSFAFYEYNPDKLDKTFISDISFDKVCINGYFYMADSSTLNDLTKMFTAKSVHYVSVKNGFATLADKVFIGNDFPFTDFLIPVLKGSTGKWYNAFFPYDKAGKPLSKEILFSNSAVFDYMECNKDKLLKGSPECSNPFWYLFGRTQALKDVSKEKIGINTTLKDVKSIKLNKVPAGSGLYSGLYILTETPFEVLSEIIISNDFIKYIASLRKYKSGGYYTFNSKDLELYLNYKLSQSPENEHKPVKTDAKRDVFENTLPLF